MIIIQILLLAFFFFTVVKVVDRFKSKDLALGGLIFWLIFWLAAGVVVLLPSTASYLAKLAGVGRGADLVVYVALALLFFLLFRATVKMEKMNKEIVKLARKIALDSHKKNNQ